MKTCTKCLQKKQLGEFRKNSQYKGGYVTFCKSCEFAYQKNNKRELK